MSDPLVPLRGMKDLLPEEYAVHKYIRDTSFNTAKLYGYKGISTPVLEAANVFDRTLGESSDVISKEMYSFHDKKGRIIALRPEFTAGIMRAVLSNNLHNRLPLKLYSCGPVFRYDRPQEGRQRQFHQINFEYIGACGAFADAETIFLAASILENIGIMDDLTLEINSLGCGVSRTAYQNVLIRYFMDHKEYLSEDSKKRLELNPLRILDSKDAKDKQISLNAPVISDFYTAESKQYFEQVLKYLEIMGIKYQINTRLARGLDYYCHTAFEFTTDKLGAQSTVLAGGRYDGLAELMGKHEIPSIGFAAGIERIALMKKFNIAVMRPVYILPITAQEEAYAVKLLNILRKNNIITLLSITGKISKRLQAAVADNASYAVFIGTEEAANNTYKVKDLGNGNETSMALPQLVSMLKG